MIFYINTESSEEVDALAIKIVKAGGELYSKRAENQGWMYGYGFKDLDDHNLNNLHIIMNLMS